MRVSFSWPLTLSMHALRTFRFLAVALLILTAVADRAAGAIIFVTTLEDNVGSMEGCSLQDAIYSANFDNNIAISGYNEFTYAPQFVTTKCVSGNGNDTIVLPRGAVFQLRYLVYDATNPFGTTATPMVSSNIIIEANGSLLQWVPSALGVPYARAFAVSSGGNLTIRNAYIKDFVVHGGQGSTNAGAFNGASFGGGGGLGAGGAIYVKGSGSLTVDNTTFENNAAIGGDGGGDNPAHSGTTGGGGGGLGGNGGGPACGAGDPFGGFGGGGGGSVGHGSAGSCGGGGGGGTAFSSFVYGVSGFLGGFDCGGDGGGAHSADNIDGQNAPCSGGGGGGGLRDEFGSGNGGAGNYGGGGGGGANGGGNGGNGGFGGGGGGGWTGFFGGTNGGNGGFGGGGGAAADGHVGGGNPGHGGLFGGNADSLHGGGGGALGGAIFSDGGYVTVRNSTFYNNFVSRGARGGGSADNGADAGGAIFSRNGSLTVVDATISGNQGTGSGAGIVVYGDGSTPSLTLYNTIIANNGANECYFTNGVTAAGVGNLIVNNGSGTAPFSACPGVVATGDPQLGPLQANTGFTPTMAIPKTSPAFNAADVATSSTTDQRGVDRPQAGGFDIGAYELCVSRFPDEVPCQRLVIEPPPDTEPLTMLVSPTGSGTVNPAPGVYSEPFDSVILISAAPNPGYSFVNWSPNVTNRNSNSTSVVMDQSQIVTANFVPGPTTMSGTITAKSGPSNARVWTLTLTNNGPGAANSAQVNSFNLTQTAGVVCTPVITSPASFPLAVGNIAPASTGSATITLNFTSCALTARFTAKFTFSANGGVVAGTVTLFNQFQ